MLYQATKKTCMSVEETEGHSVKWNKPGTEK
jgi:hypothetical protein